MVSMASSSFHFSTFLNYELTILKLNNLEVDLPLPGNLFIRYYFRPGSGKTFRVDTKSIPFSSANTMISLNHKALFECRVNSVGDDPSIIEDIKKKKMSVMLEVRWRRRGYSVFGMKMRTESKVLARVNVPWKDDSVGRWVKLEHWSRELKGKKEIEVLIGMKVWEKEGEFGRKEIECDCEGCKFGWNGGVHGDDVYF